MRAYRGRASFDVQDPILEPLWSGTRVLAHVHAGLRPGVAASVALIEELGADLAPELPALAAALGQRVMAAEAIVDGIVSRQVTLDGVGAAAIPEVRGGPTDLLLRRHADFDVGTRGTRGTGDEAGSEAAAADEPIDGFIAVDLLRLDGSDLLDVPLLERKRLLESVVLPDELIRVSAHVRPPIGTWVATWKSMGLRGGILKAANSRYRPNDDTIEWRIVERIDRRG